MYLILCALFYKLYSTAIQQNYQQTKHYQIKTNQNTAIITLPEAIDANLSQFSDQCSCVLQNKTIQHQYKNIFTIEDNEFVGLHGSQPFNLRQFNCMTLVPDGILAFTTDFILYLFQFDYKAIKSQSDSSFAQVTWKADIRKLIEEEEKFQPPQLVYFSNTELALIMFKNLAFLINVKSMIQNTVSMEVDKIESFVIREERGITKYQNGIIFSCVGEEGLDVYMESYSSLLFLSNINNYRLNEEKFNLKDLVIFKLIDQQFRIFGLDVSGIIYVIDMQVEEYEISYTIKQKIPSKGLGVSIDSENSQNLFVVYKNNHTYEVNEIWIPLDGYQNYIILDSFSTKTQITKVDSTKRFTILQSQNYLKVLYNGRQYQNSSNYIEQINLPNFIQFDLKNFNFFKLQNKMSTEFDSEGDLENSFVGIGPNKLIFSKFKVQPIEIKCFAEKQYQNQSYQLVYNTSIMTQVSNELQDKIAQNIFNFTVEFTTNNFLDIQLAHFEIWLGLAILAIILLSLWSFLKRSTKSVQEKQIQKQQTQQTETSKQEISKSNLEENTVLNMNLDQTK